MNKDKLKALYIQYGLTKEDVFKHQHYVIITRSGIEKIQSQADINVEFESKVLERDFAVIKATAYIDAKKLIQTFGSALKGDFKNGNCNTWYVAEMAEKRALSRAVLKVTGFYELGVFGEDESDDFKRPRVEPKQLINK
jgi:hypothetical protein|tara:strand:+ start:395 stop:811 length:417 start_codon:yes stop_codon:yes gene_type:complete